jgi:hypothetical protein
MTPTPDQPTQSLGVVRAPRSLRPTAGVLLDDKIRKQLGEYSALGYVGFVIREAVAYIALLEEDLVRREAGEARP